MAGLGDATKLWKLPYHTYMNLRNEYLAIVNPPAPKAEEETERVEIAPGLEMERKK